MRAFGNSGEDTWNVQIRVSPPENHDNLDIAGGMPAVPRLSWFFMSSKLDVRSRDICKRKVAENIKESSKAAVYRKRKPLSAERLSGFSPWKKASGVSL